MKVRQLSGGAVDDRVGAGDRIGGRGDELRTGLSVLVVLTAGAYLPSPLYPGYQRAFEFTDVTLTLIYATFALVSAPALVLFGSASDVLGPRSVLRCGIALAAAGSTCFALASGPGWLVAGRAAQGLALGAATGAAGALISERARGRAQGSVLAGTAFVAGTAVGPVAGGVLAEHAPAPHVLPYLLHLALLGWVWRGVSDLAAPRAVPARRWRPTRPHIPTGMRLLFAAAAMTGFLAWTAVGLFLAVIPALLDRSTRAGLGATGCVVGAVLVCSVLTQPLVARVGRWNAQLAGLAALLAGLGLLALNSGGSLSVTLVAGVVAGAGHGLAYGGAVAAVDAAVPEGERGATLGALYLAFYLGAGFPAIVIGFLTLGHPLATATSWVAAVAAGLTPPACVTVALVRHGPFSARHSRRRPDTVGGRRARRRPGTRPDVRCRSERGPARGVSRRPARVCVRVEARTARSPDGCCGCPACRSGGR